MDQEQKTNFGKWLTAFEPTRKAVGSGVSWVGNPDTSRMIFLGDGANPDADNLTRNIALATSSYCFTAISYRWRTISEPPLAILRDTEDGPEPVANHPLTDLLQMPSPDYDMGELIALTEAYRLITGAALWVKMRAGETGPTSRLVPFSGDQFTTEAADGRIYGRFMVNTATGRRAYLPEDVVHFRETNPNSWRDNLSMTDVALGQLNVGHQITRTVKNFLKKAMFPGGVVSPHQDWNPNEDEFQAYTNRIKAFHAGPGNAGEPLVLLGGTTFSGTSLSLRDLLPDELLDRIEANVASVFGIPPVVLGWLVGLKNSPWSQMSEARRMTYEDTIEPRWVDIEKKATRQMLAPAELAAGLYIAFDTSEVRALQADDAQRATTAAQMRREWTLNERRTYTGKDPIEDERGEEIDGVSKPNDFGGPDLEEDGKGIAIYKTPRTPKALHWALFDIQCKAAESSWEREVYKALKAQQAGILKLASKYLKESKALDPNQADLFLNNVAQELENGLPEFLAYLFPLVASTSKTAVKKLAAQVGVSFSILQDGLLAYAERESAFLASVMTETTGKAVAAAVQKGLEAGETVNALTARLESLPAFDRKRARLTARTETTRAWNGAQRSSMSDYQNQSGQQVFKTWINSGDDRVRDEHLDYPEGVANEHIPVDAVFSNGLTEPGEPNCRCTLIYSIAEEGPEGAGIPIGAGQ